MSLSMLSKRYNCVAFCRYRDILLTHSWQRCHFFCPSARSQETWRKNDRPKHRTTNAYIGYVVNRENRRMHSQHVWPLHPFSTKPKLSGVGPLRAAGNVINGINVELPVFWPADTASRVHCSTEDRDKNGMLRYIRKTTSYRMGVWKFKLFNHLQNEGKKVERETHRRATERHLPQNHTVKNWLGQAEEEVLSPLFPPKVTHIKMKCTKESKKIALYGLYACSTGF